MTTSEPNRVTIAGIPWELMVTRNIPFWQVTPYIAGHYHTKKFGVDYHLQQLILNTDGIHSRIFFSSENFAQYKQIVLESVDTPEKIEHLKNQYHVLAEKLLLSLGNCLADISPATWEQYIKDLTPYYAGLNLTLTLGRFGNEKLMQRLEELGYSPEEIPEIIGAITYPPEHTPLFNSQLEMLKIAAITHKNPSSDRESHLRTWLENYSHIPVNFAGEAWTLADAKNQLKEALQKDAAKELKHLEKNHTQKVKAAQAKIEEVNDSKISHLAHMLQTATNLNEFRKSVFSHASWKARAVFEKIAEMTGSAWRDCFFLTTQEIGRLLAGEAVNIPALKEERMVVGVYADNDGQIQFLDAKEIAQLQAHLSAIPTQATSQAPGTVNTLKGFSANKGKVRGIARIILGPKDFHKFHPGEILVATMTSVDFIPLMQQAAAFVTNEGGITSHASIVAREMNKPCIIGTKIATRVLKDGDLVEVDADKGVVKVLSKKH